MEYQDDIALLVGSLNEYKKSLSMIATEEKYAGSMQREFANRANTTANNLQLLKNSITETAMNLGSVLLPPLNSLVKVLRLSSSALADFTEKHPILAKVITGVTAALIGVKIAAITLGYAWTFIKGGALALMAGLQGLLTAITLVRSGLIGVNAATLITIIRMKVLAFGGIIKALGASLVGLATRAFPLVIAGLRAVALATIANPIGAE